MVDWWDRLYWDHCNPKTKLCNEDFVVWLQVRERKACFKHEVQKLYLILNPVRTLGKGLIHAVQDMVGIDTVGPQAWEEEA